MAFLDETGLTELWSLIKAEDDTIVEESTKFAIVSYVGTGASEASNPCSLTFDFPVRAIICLDSKYSDYFTGNLVHESNTGYIKFTMIVDALTTSYTEGAGFGNASDKLYGKRSADSKTVYWYVNSAYPEDQNNASGRTYYYLGIG